MSCRRPSSMNLTNRQPAKSLAEREASSRRSPRKPTQNTRSRCIASRLTEYSWPAPVPHKTSARPGNVINRTSAVDVSTQLVSAAFMRCNLPVQAAFWAQCACLQIRRMPSSGRDGARGIAGLCRNLSTSKRIPLNLRQIIKTHNNSACWLFIELFIAQNIGNSEILFASI